MLDSATITTASGQNAPSPAADAPRVWIFKPWIDLLIGCGGWSAPLLILTWYVAGSNTGSWSFAFYLLALLFNYPHFMATIYRAYHSYDQFTKYRFFTVHVAMLLALAGLLMHVWYPLLPWIFTLYICWSPWHYSGQNYGLLMMFTRRTGLSPTDTERQALHLSFIASFILLLLSFQTGPSTDSLLLSLDLPAKFTLPARAMLAVFFLAASGWALRSLAQRASWKALLPSATLVTTQFLWFLLPAVIELISGREVPQTRYSSGILAVLHSTQYLWITSYYQKKEARAEGNPAWSFPRYLLTLVAGGIALFVPGPWIVSRMFHADFASSFLTFTALVNLHHFLLDGAIWKLRDSRIASLLLNKRTAGEEVAVKPEGRLAAAAHWLAGAKPGARAVRIVVVLLLLVWGGIDRLHFYWVNVSASLASLRRAATLNPNDSSVEMRLAQASQAAGDGDASLAALRQAVALNPDNKGFVEAYARGLITTGHDRDAYALYRNLLARAPHDVDSLVNYGLLALRLGHEQEAVDSWQRAVDTDPMQTNAQLYLAQALEKRGEVQAAARHYRAYLQIVGLHPNEHRGEGPMAISALLKVADADADAQHPQQALVGYRAAAQFAQRLGNVSLESLAMVRAAEAQERTGEIAGAAHSIQDAVTLDESQGEPQAAASDWFNYGQFLRRQKQPERLVFACFYRAEDLMSTTLGQELSAIVKARQESAARLGQEANSLPAQLSRLLSEALSLSPSAFTANQR